MAYFNRGFRRRSFNREPTKITCAECGKEDTVPFKPREGSTVLCRDCFLKKKGITPRERTTEPESEETESPEETEEPAEEFGEETE
ncbi:MAG: hypothetical protein K6T16_02580 [Candidatus Pacearchaeota archaeon]|nr:hypothetical protein [Candidatus Pacearchaeota archaeon]